MRLPAKLVFSRKYTWYGILGALGLSDHGSPLESDMVQMFTRRISVEGGIEGRGGGGSEMEKGPLALEGLGGIRVK